MSFSHRLRLTCCLAALAVCVQLSVSAQAGRGERTLYVTAVDARGEPVTGLPAEAFIVREDGVRREVLRAAPTRDPLDLALLLDNSTAAAPLITHLRSALPGLIDTVAPGNHIAIITLASRPTVVVDYTSDVSMLKKAVGRLFALPDTGATLLDAIVETSQGLGRRDTPRAVILAIVTDGTEFTNRYAKDVVAALHTAGATLDLLTIGTFDASLAHPSRERMFLLEQGPAATGGVRVNLLTPMSLGGALDRLARVLVSQYKVVYSRPDSLIPPGRVEISSGRAGVTMRGLPARGESHTP